MSNNVLVDRDINASSPKKTNSDSKSEANGLEYPRQMFQPKVDDDRGQQTYISPSDTIMSPCTAKLSAYRHSQLGKAKPKSLFPKASNKGHSSIGSVFGAPNPSSENLKTPENIKIEEQQIGNQID